MTARRNWPLLLPLAAALAAFAFPLVIALGSPTASSDVKLFQRYGERVTAGQVPYRDFAVEYPPGAFVPWLVAGPTADPEASGYVTRFVLLMGAAAGGIALLTVTATRRLGASRRRQLLAAVVAGALPFLLGGFAFERYDYWPALLVTIGLAAVAGRRSRVAAVALGLGAAAKLWPILLAPVLAGAIRAPGGGRRLLAWCAASVVVVVLPFAVLAPHGLVDSVRGQAARPLQIESTGASLLLIGRAASGTPVEPVLVSGAYALPGRTAEQVAAVSGVLEWGLVAVALLLGLRRSRIADGDGWVAVRAAAAVTVALVAFGRVLSPQYLVWLMPFAGLLVGSRRRADVLAGALLVGAIAMTGVEFPDLYYRLWPHPAGVAVAGLVLRNLLLVAACAVLLAGLRPGPRRPAGRLRAEPS